MRRALPVIGVLLLALAGAWWLQRPAAGPLDLAPGGAPAPAAVRRAPFRSAGEAARGSLSIRGRVRGEGAGVQVTATRRPPVARQDPSRRPGCAEWGAAEKCPCELTGERLDALRVDSVALAEAMGTTRTDASGEFTIERLDPGRYDVWVEAGARVGVRDQVEAGSAGVDVHVVGWLAASGAVVGEDGKDVPRPDVAVVDETRGRAWVAVGDERGRFDLGLLPLGSYALFAEAPGYLPFRGRLGREARRLRVELSTDRSFTGEVVGAQGPVEVVLQGNTCEQRMSVDPLGRFAASHLADSPLDVIATSGQRWGWASVRFRDARAPHVRIELGPGGTVAGRVTVEGEPVARARVELSGGAVERHALTDAAGNYRVEGVPAGEWRATAEHAEVFPMDDEPKELTVAAGAEVHVDLAMQRGLRLHGRVQTSQGAALPNAEVALTGAADDDGVSDDAHHWGETTTTTDHDGGFDYGWVAKGRRRLEARLAGWAPTAVTFTPDGKPVTLVMEQGLVLSGTVSSGGRRVAGVGITAVPRRSAGRGSLEPETEDALHGSSDESGAFQLGGLTAGLWWVQARDDQREVSTELEVGPTGASVELVLPSARQISGTVEAEAGGRLEEGECVGRPGSSAGRPTSASFGPDGVFALEVFEDRSFVVTCAANLGATSFTSEQLAAKPGDRLKVLVRPFPRVRGRVVDASGQPVEAFSLNLRPLRTTDGRFDSQVGRDGEVVIEAPGFEAVRLEAGGAPGGHADLGDVVLPRTRTLRVTVVEAGSRAPIAGAEVRLQVAPGGRLHREPSSGVTDPAGETTLREVAADMELLVVSHARWPEVQRRIDARAGTATVEVPVGARIKGSLRDARGGPVGGVAVLAASLASEAAKEDVTDSGGAFDLGPLGGGAWAVQVSPLQELKPAARALLPVPTTVELEAGATARVDLVLKSHDGTVEVRFSGQRPDVAGGTWTVALVARTPGSPPQSRNLAAIEAQSPHVEQVGEGWLFPNVPQGEWTAVAAQQHRGGTMVFTRRFQLTGKSFAVVFSPAEQRQDIPRKP